MSGEITVKELLDEVVSTIKDYCIENNENYNKIALLITSQILNIDKARIIASRDMKIEKSQYKNVIEAAKKYILGYPLQYCTNRAYFMGMEFYVDENVLIPRSDTETLIYLAIELFKDKKNLLFLDIGTGSGCIAISLAKYLDCNVVAVDISEKAIKIAQKNAFKNDVDEKLEFLKSDLFESIPDTYRFDAIFSNPPYISEDELGLLDKKVLKEPHIALFAPKDGYYYFREIAKKAKYYLKKDGYLIFEVGFSQAQKTEKILSELTYVNIKSKKDLNGIKRCVFAQIV